MMIFHSYVNVYQRVSHLKNAHMLGGTCPHVGTYLRKRYPEKSVVETNPRPYAATPKKQTLF